MKNNLINPACQKPPMVFDHCQNSMNNQNYSLQTGRILKFQPTLLDLLYDVERNKYVQFAGGCFNAPLENAMFRCKDIETQDIVEYSLGNYDIVEEMPPYLMAIMVLPEDLQKNVLKIDEGVSLTGKIVKNK